VSLSNGARYQVIVQQAPSSYSSTHCAAPLPHVIRSVTLLAAAGSVLLKSHSLPYN